MTNPAREVGQLRKAGQLDAALARARETFASNPRDSYLQMAYGWVLYELLKRDADALNKSRMPVSQVAGRFRQWLAEYQQLGLLPRPDLLHSLFLTQALKVSKETQTYSGFLPFLRWANPQALRPEDREPFTVNGKPAPSLELRLLYVIGRCAAAGEDDPEHLAWADGVLADALAAHPDDQWLHYFKSKRLIAQGRAAEAREFLLPIIKRRPREYWLWDLLGQIWAIDDRPQAIVCYYRAVQLGEPEKVLKTRVRLAECLVALDRQPEAARQVHTALEDRQRHNWRTPPDLAQLARADWYRRLAGEGNLPAEPDVARVAETILFGEETAVKVGVIDGQNTEKGVAHVAFSATVDDGVVLPYRKFRKIAQYPVGALVEVHYRDEPPTPYSVTTPAIKTIEGFCQSFAGELRRRPGQAFGFIEAETGERIFVPPSLLADVQLEPNEPANCRAIYAIDRKSGKPGWRALNLVLQHE